MTPDNATINSFFIVDAIQVEGIESMIPFATSERPDWIYPVYRDEIAQFGPMVLDIEAAFSAGQLDMLLALVNAMTPQLHLSIVDTHMVAPDLAQHLKNFIFVRTEGGKDLTLRFADCAVLPALAAHFTDAQWATFHRIVLCWRVHQRNGSLAELDRPSETRPQVETPLCLSFDQIAKIKDVMLPDQMLARVRDMASSDQINGTVAEQHAWASNAHILWRASENNRIEDLEILTEIAVATRGEALGLRGVNEVIRCGGLDSFGMALMEAKLTSGLTSPGPSE